MFIGHFGAGLAAKKIVSRPSLGTMFLAAQFIDLLWPILLLLGIERVQIVQSMSPFTRLDFTYYPYSHSLLFVLIWGLLFGIVYFMLKRDLRTSVILGSLVVSHWILDFLVHIPDLPLSAGETVKVGLGLWNSVPVTLVLELLLFTAGIYFYTKSTQAVNRKGSIGLWSLLVFLAVVYAMSILSPPPTNVQAIAVTGNLQWLFIIWAWWVDRNRKAVSGTAGLQFNEA